MDNCEFNGESICFGKGCLKKLKNKKGPFHFPYEKIKKYEAIKVTSKTKTYCPDNYEEVDKNNKCKFKTKTDCEDLGLIKCDRECSTTKSLCTKRKIEFAYKMV